MTRGMVVGEHPVSWNSRPRYRMFVTKFVGRVSNQVSSTVHSFIFLLTYLLVVCKKGRSIKF